LHKKALEMWINRDEVFPNFQKKHILCNQTKDAKDYIINRAKKEIVIINST
jgi:hypothetical protein